jgi:hypothetical protein
MGLRETLAERGLPQAEFPLRRVPSLELTAAENELRDASAALAAAEASRTVSTAHRTRVDEAADRLRACYTFLVIKAIPPKEMEELIAAHKAPDDKPNDLFDQHTFMPELLARCVYDAPDAAEPALSADEWTLEIQKGSSSAGEIGALFQATWNVNDRAPDSAIPKGSTRTAS